MAAQNALVEVSGRGAPTTAVMPTDVTRFTMDVGEILLGNDAGAIVAARRRASHAWPAILGFAVGAAVGAGLYAILGLASLVLPTGLAVVSLGRDSYPQPGADPALPVSQRQGHPGRRPAGGHRRGLDADGAYLLRDEGAWLAAPPVQCAPRRSGWQPFLGARHRGRRYVEDYGQIRDTMAQALVGFEDFNRRARRPRSSPQPAGPRAGLRHAVGSRGVLARAAATIYSNDDRYRGLKGLRTMVFMNEGDMCDRDLAEFDLIDVTSIGKDGSRRTAYSYRVARYEVPRGCAAGYMPELNILCESPTTAPRVSSR